MAEKRFQPEDVIICPECGLRPEGASYEIRPADEHPLFVDGQQIGVVKTEADKIMSVVLTPCEHKFDRIVWWVHPRQPHQKTVRGWMVYNRRTD